MKYQRAIVLTIGLGMALFITAIPATQAKNKDCQIIKTPGTQGLPFSDGIVAGNTMYVAGQEGVNDQGKLIEGGIAPETEAALRNIEKILKAGGYELGDVVSVTVYLADIHEFGEMNKVYKSIMPDPKPVRATVQVAALVNNARVEISAIAVKAK